MFITSHNYHPLDYNYKPIYFLITHFCLKTPLKCLEKMIELILCKICIKKHHFGTSGELLMSLILLVEDNKKQAESLKKHLTGIADCDVLHAINSKSAFEYAVKYNIDLFVLDIGLPDKSGLKLAEEIRSLPMYKYTWIIFLTALEQFLPQALSKVHCYDFITKPYDLDKVKKTISELISDNNIKNKDAEQKFTILCKDFSYHIEVNKILFIEVNQKICFIHTYFDTAKINRLSLKKCSLQLPEQKFVQCHKSIIVNIDYIHYIKKDNTNWEISLINYPTKLPVGEKYQDNLFKAVGPKIALEEKNSVC